MTRLTHLDAAGAAHMVDVSDKAATPREAVARGTITMSPAALAAVRDGNAAKGDVFATARIAGIMAAKRTAELIPLCHPIALASVAVEVTAIEDGIAVTATARTSGATGVEMEALAAVTVALLTVYDMAKALDRSMTIGNVGLVAKIGRAVGRLAGMITPAEAQARLLALAPAISTERVPLTLAAGRWAATDVVARRTQPARDVSAMDGYAVRATDTPGPWRVVGTSAAGAPFAGYVEAGETVRIFTGAILPAGTDRVVIQEDARRDDALMSLNDPANVVRASRWVRRAGSDFEAGNRLIAAGTQLTPLAIALAAAGGHGALAVHRRLRVAIVSTGDELIAAGLPCSDDRLPDANRPMIAALIADLPVDVIDAGIVGDDRSALIATFIRLATCDIVVTSGGVSVGDHDLVRPALAGAGATLDFWRVAMRPGKPLMAGRLGDAVVLGLPGNPVSAFVTATLFLRPLIAQLCGAADPLPSVIAAAVASGLPAVGARTDYVRARWVDGRLLPLPSHDSGALHATLPAQALIVRAAGAPALPALAWVDAIPTA